MTLCKRCIISDLYRFIYYEIPRCATRSMLKYFIRKPAINYGAMRLATGDVTGERKDYYKFTFVRNPYERLVSCYQQKINNTKKPGLHMHSEGLRYGMPFGDFVDFVVRHRPVGQMDVHFRPQYCFVDDSMHVYKLETLNTDFIKALNDIGLEPYRIPHINAAMNKDNWKRYYDKRTRDLVSKFYKKDLEQFGYDF